MAGKSILEIFGRQVIARRIGGLQGGIILELGLVETPIGKQCLGHTGEHATRIVVQKCLHSRRSGGVPVEQSAHIVDITIHHDPLLIGTFSHILQSVHRPFPAKQHGDEAEDANEETRRQEDAKANRHLFAPRLLRLGILLFDATVRHAARHASTEVVPPHGALVIIDLLLGHGLGLLGRLVAARSGGDGAARTIAAGIVRALVVVGVHRELPRHGARRAERVIDVGTNGGVAGVVTPLIGDVALLIVGVITARHARLLGFRIVGLFVRVGRLAVAAHDGGGSSSPPLLHLRGRRRSVHIVVGVIVDSRSVVPAVGIVRAEFVTHPVGIVSVRLTVRRVTTVPPHRPRRRGRHPHPHSLAAHAAPTAHLLRIARGISRRTRPRIVSVVVPVRIDGASRGAAAPVRTSGAPAGGAGTTAHLIVVVVAPAPASIVIVELGADFAVALSVHLTLSGRHAVIADASSRDLVDHAHEVSGVGGSFVVVHHGNVAVTSGRALGEGRCDALRGVPVDGPRGLSDAAIALGDAESSAAAAISVVVGTWGRRTGSVLRMALMAVTATAFGGGFGTDGLISGHDGVGIAHHGFGFDGVVGGEAGGEGGHGRFVVTARHDWNLSNVVWMDASDVSIACLYRSGRFSFWKV
mmetsp:Transcript_41776/g.87664  ORF Transcript_41776/g.87664 Transcript_41776/m.87664 type:complete len:639 (+) Transcript_41776:2138-4054(+)